MNTAKFLFPLALALAAPCQAIADNPDDSNADTPYVGHICLDDDDCVVAVIPEKNFDHLVALEACDVLPQYPGGETALMSHLALNLCYPADACEQKVEGCVVVSFVVSKTGEVANIATCQSVHPSLDAEAMRVVSTLDKFIPGTVNGQPVNVHYRLPISFRLQ